MNRLYRGLFTLTLLLGLLIGLVGPSLILVKAAPQRQASYLDVIINEVAWAGTQADPNAQWIELHNTTSNGIDLSGWVLKATDNTPNVVLSAVILPEDGYYLLERTNDDTVFDIPADQIYTGDLIVDGEALTLRDTGGNLIDSANQTGGVWPAGSALTRSSMERIDAIPDAPSSWKTNDGFTKNGHDVSSNPINGTPKQINSATASFNLTATASAANLTGTALGWTPTPTGLLPTATPTITLTPTITTPVISEVAWAGTKTSPNDEWIELYNPGFAAVDITGWLLEAKDGLPLIVLSGTIPAAGFYLIERGSDNVVSDVRADLVYTFDLLSDEGETLYLKNASHIIVDSANKSGIAWPAGQTGGFYPTMERAKTNGQIAPDGPFAWVTNNGTVKNGHDAAGNAIYGTPKQANWPLLPTATPTRTITPTRTRTPAGTISTATPTATPTLGLIINEVAWMGTQADPTAEWVELYNPTSANVNLTDWTLKSTDGSINIPLTGIIYATGSTNPNQDAYYVIASTIKTTFLDVVIDQEMPTSLSSFNNNGASLQLINPSGILVDTANSDGGTWPAGIPSPTTAIATMERHAATLDHASSWYTYAGPTTGPTIRHDRDGNGIKGTPGYANWAVSVTATPTKTPTHTPRPPTKRATNLPPIVATLVINEFLPRAGFDWNKDGKVDVFDEYIEIANLGPIDANLANWKLDDMAGGGSSPFTLPSRTLKPGERAIFYASQTNVLLSDGGDTVRLLNPNNVIKDAHTYSLVKVADQSICRLPDINGSWYTDCVPTPNARNSRTGTVPSAPPGTGLEEPLCQLPDTLPADFQLAECYGFGSNMWNPAYWDGIWQGDRSVPQNGSKWDTFIE